MEWVRIDVDFWGHPRTGGLSDAAQLAYLRMLCWCGEHETDWVIPTAIPRRFGAGPKVVAELVGSGCWEPVEGGWHIHDAEDRQMLDEVRAQREQRSEHARKAARARWNHARALPEDCPSNAPAMPTVTVTDTSTTTRVAALTSVGPEGAAAALDLSIEAIAEQALVILAERRVAKAVEAGKCGNPAAYRHSAINGLRKDHAASIVNLDPAEQWTPQLLADWLEPPPPPPKPAEPHPLDISAAAAENYRRNDEQLADTLAFMRAQKPTDAGREALARLRLGRPLE